MIKEIQRIKFNFGCKSYPECHHVKATLIDLVSGEKYALCVVMASQILDILDRYPRLRVIQAHVDEISILPLFQDAM
ncbi:hypothetical protein [Alicyclobacillus fastidiosus]|uniref:hypothetical protein n=1 Tax=Alicyclobacillus fastidiosus TaxID=392011 RepID=UPI0024E0EC91|nr:hypothetical protein [Alicyclobacillus fastidiosus]